MALKIWINEKYLKKERIKELNNEFTTALNFKHISIEDFFKSEKLKEIEKELDSLEYYKESSDLYEFYRTVDFKNITNSKIYEFREFLRSKEFICFIENITGIVLKKAKIDTHSLLLTNTDYLLCHDDRVQGRKIAFVINFSNFQAIDGGELEFFEEKKEGLIVFKSILPKFNKFNMFEVSDKSFHQIREVLFEKERITIGGWFYDS